MARGLTWLPGEEVEWCPGPELNRYVLLRTRDFKSRASASFATRAGCWNFIPHPFKTESAVSRMRAVVLFFRSVSVALRPRGGLEVGHGYWQQVMPRWLLACVGDDPALSRYPPCFNDPKMSLIFLPHPLLTEGRRDSLTR